MREENEVRGSLIERNGRYYVLLYYYVDDQRISETKATGIAVKDHKKREAERIKMEMVQKNRSSYGKRIKYKSGSCTHLQTVFRAGLTIRRPSWKVLRQEATAIRARPYLLILKEKT